MAGKQHRRPKSLTTDFTIKDVPSEHAELARVFFKVATGRAGKTEGQFFAEMIEKICLDRLGPLETNRILRVERENLQRKLEGRPAKLDAE